MLINFFAQLFSVDTRIYRNSSFEFVFANENVKKQARKGFRPISASEGLLVRKVNNLINKRTEHWSCRIFVQQVK